MSYVAPHLRRLQGESQSSSSPTGYYPYGRTFGQEAEEHKPKTVIAGQDLIDYAEIRNKSESELSMAEKLALSANEAPSTKRGNKQQSKRQAQFKLEKDSIISDKDFYEEQLSRANAKLDKVVINAAVLTHIVQHAESKRFDSATGNLIGSYKDGVLNISTAFATEGDSSFLENKAGLQADNFFCFDNVGWYSTMNMDSHLDVSTISAQYRYQWEHGNQCVFLVYDTSACDLKGVMRLHALRLSDSFMNVVRTVAEQNQSNSVKNSSNKQQQEEELRKQIQLKVQYGGLPPYLPQIDKESLNSLKIKDLFDEIDIEFQDNDLLRSFIQDLDTELRLDSYCEERDTLDLNTRETLQNRMHALHNSQKELKKIVEGDPNRAGLEHLVLHGRIFRHLREIQTVANEGMNKVELIRQVLKKPNPHTNPSS